MNQTKRYHPLLLLFYLWNLVKGSFFFAVFLFVIKFGSNSTFIKYGKFAFFLFIGIILVSIVLKWFTQKYKLSDTSFHIYKGVFRKSERTIPFSKIQNVNRRTSLFHRIFKVTSIRLETGMAGMDAAIEFEVISLMEADQIEEYMTNPVQNEANPIYSQVDSNRIIHFKPTRGDILKASFTSLSFIILIPILGSLYNKINEIFNVEEELGGLVAIILNSWWIVTLMIIVLVIASTTLGIIRVYLKYGKYEISSDQNQIYITRGIVDETAFSIYKDKVQAIEITQSIMKRLFGLAEVKLISAGGLSFGDDKLEISSLYPFLPVKRAYEMISEILPSYEVKEMMTRLPKRSLWIRMLKPSWFWMIATVVLLYFKPPVLELEQAWWMISVALLVFIGISRWLDFLNTRYILNNNFIQFKTGSLQTTLFISKRDKVIEIKVTRNKLQQLLGLASIGMINRAKPVHHTGIDDVPVELADTFYTWYVGRRNEVDVE
ncbi:PH domain-containing protein [Paenibacillus sp. FA6]|uniref:PH domain-containing protein n=1 Tax=Paenibacillus sp. FA6 TaxID=3413029 RepID=UPI003F6567C4